MWESTTFIGMRTTFLCHCRAWLGWRLPKGSFLVAHQNPSTKGGESVKGIKLFFTMAEVPEQQEKDRKRKARNKRKAHRRALRKHGFQA